MDSRAGKESKPNQIHTAVTSAGPAALLPGSLPKTFADRRLVGLS